VHWNEVFVAADATAESAVLVIETEARATVHKEAPRGWKSVRQRDYGRTTVGFFVRDGVIADG
jgi:16S rRNA G966 N2-methylase RsmD